MESKNVHKIAYITGLEPRFYHHSLKKDFYKGIKLESNPDFIEFDPIISKNQLRYVSEGIWMGGTNVVNYFNTYLKYVSKDDILFRMDADTWNPKIMKLETVSHLVCLKRRKKNWKQLKNDTVGYKKIYLKYIAEMI